MSYEPDHDSCGALDSGSHEGDVSINPVGTILVLPLPSTPGSLYVDGHSTVIHGNSWRSPPFKDSTSYSQDFIDTYAHSILKPTPSQRPHISRKVEHGLKHHRSIGRMTTPERDLSLLGSSSDGMACPENPEKDDSPRQSPLMQAEISDSSEQPCSCSHGCLDHPIRQRSTSPIDVARGGRPSEHQTQAVVIQDSNLAIPRPALDKMRSVDTDLDSYIRTSNQDVRGTIKVREWLEDKEYSLESLVHGPIPRTDEGLKPMMSESTTHHDLDTFAKSLGRLTLSDHLGIEVQKIEETADVFLSTPRTDHRFLADGNIDEREVQRKQDESHGSSYTSVAFAESFVEHDKIADEPFPIATRAMENPCLRDMLQQFLESLSLNRIDVAKEILLSIISLDNVQTVALEDGESAAAGVNSKPHAQVKASHSLSPQNSKRPRQSKKRTERDQRGDDDDNHGDFKRRRTHGTPEEPRMLACLFHKRNPTIYNGFTHIKFRSCAGPGWKAMNRVKEHLRETHKRPIRIDPSRPLSYRNSQIEELNADQLLELSKQSPRNLDSRGKWRELYKRVFGENDERGIPEPYYTDGDHIDGDHIDGDHIDGDHIDGDHIDGDHIDGDHIDGDHIDGDHIDGDHIDGDSWTEIFRGIARWSQEYQLQLDSPASIETFIHILRRYWYFQVLQLEIPWIQSQSYLEPQNPEVYREVFQEHGQYMQFASQLQENVPTSLAVAANVHDNNTSLVASADESTVPTDRSEIFSRSAAGPSLDPFGDIDTSQSIHDAAGDSGMNPSVTVGNYNAYDTPPDYIRPAQQIQVSQSEENLRCIDHWTMFETDEDELRGMQRYSPY